MVSTEMTSKRRSLFFLYAAVCLCHLVLGVATGDRRDTRFIDVIDPHWFNWQPWHHCSVTCGGGVRQRLRECHFPFHTLEQGFCHGPGVEEESCNDQLCPTVSTS